MYFSEVFVTLVVTYLRTLTITLELYYLERSYDESLKTSYDFLKLCIGRHNLKEKYYTLSEHRLGQR